MFLSASFNDYLAALKKRHDYFAANGCAVFRSWTGRDLCGRLYAGQRSMDIFAKIRSGGVLS